LRGLHVCGLSTQRLHQAAVVEDEAAQAIDGSADVLGGVRCLARTADPAAKSVVVQR
jgi:hypothetical protein